MKNLICNQCSSIVLKNQDRTIDIMLGRTCFITGLFEEQVKVNFIKITAIYTRNINYTSQPHWVPLRCSLYMNEQWCRSSEHLLLSSGTLDMDGVCNTMIMRSYILEEMIIKVLCFKLRFPPISTQSYLEWVTMSLTYYQ